MKKALQFLLAAFILAVVAAALVAALAVVPFLFHGDLADAVLTGVGSVAFMVVGLLFYAWRERRNRRRD